MKIYIASSWKNPHYNTVKLVLEQIGHEIMDWRDPVHAFAWEQVDESWRGWDRAGFASAMETPRAKEAYKHDYCLMCEADLCLLLLPSGRSAHSEAGFMAGKGKRVYVYIPEYDTPELMYGLYDKILVNELDLVKEFVHLMDEPRQLEYAGLLKDGIPETAVFRDSE